MKFHIEGDKILHFIVSFFLYLIIALAFRNLYMAVWIVFAIGIGKELYDNYIQKTYFDLEDLAFDVIGIFLAYLLLIF